MLIVGLFWLALSFKVILLLTTSAHHRQQITNRQKKEKDLIYFGALHQKKGKQKLLHAYKITYKNYQRVLKWKNRTRPSST